MKEKKTKTFIVDGKTYKFNHSKFKEAYMFQLGQSRKGHKVNPRHDRSKQAKTEQSFREEMASEICTSPDAIKKWRYGINSPGSIEIISDIEKYLQVEKGSLLLENVPNEINEMKKENVPMTNRIIPDYERNAVRTIYLKLVELFEAFEETGGAQYFAEYEIMPADEYYDILYSTESVFHKNMMDIPENVYKELFKIYMVIRNGFDNEDYLMDDFYGVTGDWFRDYVEEYCNENYEDKDAYKNLFIEAKCLHELVDSWYQEVRVILKDYIPA